MVGFPVYLVVIFPYITVFFSEKYILENVNNDKVL